MKTKVFNTIEKYNLISENDRIVVGVSGGADSVALLDILVKLQEKISFTILVAHVNHNIRIESIDDELFVQDLCQKYNVPFYIRSGNIQKLSKTLKLSEEEAGRHLRYDFFKELAGQNGKIVTAHHLNDNIETVIMKFLRGTSLEGLSGIDYQNGQIIRPFLDISRAEIEKYIEDNNLSYVTDKTNFMPIYTRNKVRLELIPYIKENLNPGIETSLSDSISLYREDNDFINEETNKLYNNNVQFDNEIIKIKKEILINNHKSLSSRVLIKMYNAVNKQYSVLNKRTIENILDLLNKNAGTLNIRNNIITEVNNEYLMMYKYKEPEYFDKEQEYDINIGEEILVDNFIIKSSVCEEKDIINNGNHLYLPYEKYKYKVFTIRYRKEKDIFQKDENSTTSLKKFLNKKKIKSIESSRLPMLEINNKIYWVISKFGTHISNRTGKFIKFEIIK